MASNTGAVQSKSSMVFRMVCRYCLADSNTSTGVAFISDAKQIYENMVKETFNIQILNSKSQDNMLCLKCVENLRIAAETKRTILEVQKVLMKESQKLADIGGDVKQLDCLNVHVAMKSLFMSFSTFLDDCDNKIHVKFPMEVTVSYVPGCIEIEQNDDPVKQEELETDYQLDDLLEDDFVVYNKSIDKDIDNSDIKIERDDIVTLDNVLDSVTPDSIKNGVDSEIICSEGIELKDLGDLKTTPSCSEKRIILENKLTKRCINKNNQQSKATVKRRRNIKKTGDKSLLKGKNDRELDEYDVETFDDENSTNAKSNTRKVEAFDRDGYIRKNTITLIKNTNMCPFKSKRPKYGCFFCRETFLTIKDLRKHTHNHTIDQKVERRITRNRGMSFICVDISNLTCRLCSETYREIEELKQHFVTHGLSMESAGHLLVPFRLEEGFQCVICREEFQTFTRLNIHMNSHSTSNVCEKCGLAYTNRMSLRNHLKSQHSCVKCTQCAAIFPTTHTRSRHMRKVHKIGEYKRYCTLCDMTFSYTHQLYAHKVEKHGEKQETVSCEHCGKKFGNALGLRTHIRSVHIGERNYPCSKCEKRFFTKCDMNRHEKTHGSDKPFSCHLCEVKFRSKDSYRRHLRRQHKT